MISIASLSCFRKLHDLGGREKSLLREKLYQPRNHFERGDSKTFGHSILYQALPCLLRLVPPRRAVVLLGAKATLPASRGSWTALRCSVSRQSSGRGPFQWWTPWKSPSVN